MDIRRLLTVIFFVAVAVGCSSKIETSAETGVSASMASIGQAPANSGPQPASSIRFSGHDGAEVPDVGASSVATPVAPKGDAAETGAEVLDSDSTATALPAPPVTTTAAPALAPDPAPAPAPAPAPDPAPAPAPDPVPAPVPRFQVNCPNGTVVVVDERPSMEAMREMCSMTPSPALTGGTIPSTGSSGSSMTYRITCSNGATHTFDRRLSDAERDELCGSSPTTTTVPLPRVTGVIWTYADGSPVTNCVNPPDETWRETFPDRNWCRPPAPEVFRWKATYDNGEVLSGETPALSRGDEWSHTPNGWNGAVWIVVHDINGISYGAGWD